MKFSRPATLRSARQKQRHRRRVRVWLIVSVFLVVGGIAAAAYGSHLPSVTLATVRIEGAEAVSEKALEETVNAVLSKKYLGLFSKRNVFLYPRRALSATLHNSFERLASVEITAPDFSTLVVAVQERVPHGLWCGERDVLGGGEAEGTDEADSPCYFLDETGFLFAPAAYFSGGVFLSYYGPLNAPEPLGAHFLSEESFRETEVLIRGLRELALEPVSLAVDAVDFSVELKGDGVLLAARNRPVAETLENLRSFLFAPVPGDTSTENAGYVFRYLDARFGNKVFFKRK